MKNYNDLDLSLNGEVANELMASLDKEAARNVELIDHGYNEPAGITPQMRNWFASSIAPLRKLALTEIDNELSLINNNALGDPILLERALWEADRELIREKRRVTADTKDKLGNVYEALKKDEEEEDKATRLFESTRNSYAGREPQIFNPYLYFFILVLLGVTDMALNWQHIYDANISDGSPILAAGIAFVIAVCIGIAGHCLGVVLKQHKQRFGVHNDDADIKNGKIHYGIVITTITMGMSIVAWIRWSYFNILTKDVVLLGTEAPSLFATVAGSMTSNFGVFMVGTLFAYITHDEDQLYVNTKKKLDKLGQAISSHKDKITRKLTPGFDKASEKAKLETQRARNCHKSFANDPNYQEARRLMDNLLSQDARVLSILQNYKSELTRSCVGKSVVFSRISEIDEDKKERLSPEQYDKVNLEMTYA